MEKIIKRELLDTLAERVKLATSNRGDWSRNPEWEKRYRALLALPPGSPEAAYLEIVEDQFWTANKCGECGRDVEVTIQLGDDALYDLGSVQVCLDCLGKAAELGYANYLTEQGGGD